MTDELTPVPEYIEKPTLDAAKKKASPKKSAKKPGPKKRVAKPTDGANLVMSGDVDNYKPPKKRIPMHRSASEITKGEQLDPTRKYRDCADRDNGQIKRYRDGGYEFERDENGNKIKRTKGETLYRMSIPKDLYDQDQLAKRKKIIDTNHKVQADAAPKGGAVPEYVVSGQNSAIARDDL